MAMDTTTKKQRSRPEGLTETKEAIIHAVSDLRFVTVDEILRLLFKKGSRTHARALLRDLSGGQDGQKHDYRNCHYLYRFGLPSRGGNYLRVYTLGAAGAKFLRERGIPIAFYYRPEKASFYSYGYLMHELAVAKIQVALRVFARDYPDYQLVETRTSYELLGSPPCISVVDAGGHETASTVIPDCWVLVEHTPSKDDPQSVQSMPLWIELDHGTEAKTRYQQLLRNRITLIRTGTYADYFGTPSVRLVYLAFGKTPEARFARLLTLRRWTEDVLTEEKLTDWATVFSFSTIEPDLYENHRLFTHPVWLQPFSPTPVRLFAPPQVKEEPDEHSTPPQTSFVDEDALLSIEA